MLNNTVPYRVYCVIFFCPFADLVRFREYGHEIELGQLKANGDDETESNT